MSTFADAAMAVAPPAADDRPAHVQPRQEPAPAPGGFLSRLRRIPPPLGILAGLLVTLPFFGMEWTFGVSVPGNPFLVLLPSVLMASVLFRWYGGLAALAVTAAYIDYFHLDPPGWGISDPAHLLAFGTYLAVGGYVITLVHALHAALGRQERLIAEQRRMTAEQERLLEDLRASHAELAAAEEAKDVLVKEMNHRVKNAVASVAAVGRQTMRTATDLRDFETSFSARIDALTRTQDLVALHGYAGGCSLADVVRCELEPFLGKGGLDLGGPEVLMGPKSAMALGLSLHELATNAAKYGGLSDKGTGLKVSWSTPGDGVRLDWVETVAEPPAEPRRKGYGTRLLEHSIRSMGGKAGRNIAADGYRFRIEVPLSGLAA